MTFSADLQAAGHGDAEIVLLTGASRGLGRAIASRLAKRGAGLILTARSAADLAGLADDLSRLTRVVAVPGDVADPDHRIRLVERGRSAFGRIDALINNASDLGPAPLPPLADYPLAGLERVLAVNVIAPLALAQLVLPDMIARRRGVIINVSSDAAVNAYPGWGGYGASKAALDQISRVLAEEAGPAGVRVYAVDPGDMKTAMHAAAEPGVDLAHLPGPEVPAPAFLTLINDPHWPSGRYEAADLITHPTVWR